jgi:hypothetical protein
MWNYYFDNNCIIYAIDINNDCLKLQKDYANNVHIIIGDQGDEQFWNNFLNKNIKFDIIVDDGSHIPTHQILTFKKTYDYLNNNGIYLCEDICTSYYKKYNNSFIDFCKKIIDYLNVYHWDRNISEKYINFKKKTYCISFYDNIVVIDKQINEKPYQLKKIINNNFFEINKLTHKDY